MKTHLHKYIEKDRIERGKKGIEKTREKEQAKSTETKWYLRYSQLCLILTIVLATWSKMEVSHTDELVMPKILVSLYFHCILKKKWDFFDSLIPWTTVL